MAGTGMQNKPSEPQREVAPRSEYGYHYGPSSLMRRLSEEMDRTFGGFFGWPLRGGHTWTPAIEVREQGGNVEVTAELPGLKKEDVKVDCTEEGIIIQGEKRENREETEGGVHRSERTYGRFYRMIPLPAGVETDKVKAEFKDGLLHVTVPIPENKRRRSVPIAA